MKKVEKQVEKQITQNDSLITLLKKEIGEYCSDIREDSSAILTAVKSNMKETSKQYKNTSKVDGQQEPSLLELLTFMTFDSKSCVFENKTTQGFVMRVSHFTGINERAKNS